jgi:hypothetical protein
MARKDYTPEQRSGCCGRPRHDRARARRSAGPQPRAGTMRRDIDRVLQLALAKAPVTCLRPEPEAPHDDRKDDRRHDGHYCAFACLERLAAARSRT